jgi:hypothetical protein
MSRSRPKSRSRCSLRFPNNQVPIHLLLPLQTLDTGFNDFLTYIRTKKRPMCCSAFWAGGGFVKRRGARSYGRTGATTCSQGSSEGAQRLLLLVVFPLLLRWCQIRRGCMQMESIFCTKALIVKKWAGVLQYRNPNFLCVWDVHANWA